MKSEYITFGTYGTDAEGKYRVEVRGVELPKPYFEDEKSRLFDGDALEIMRFLPNNSIDLIAVDPPYNKVKNIDWDKQWKSDAEFLSWIGDLCREWKRLLKPNGSLYCFASPEMNTRVDVKIREFFNVLNNIRWHKEAGWHNKAEKESLRSYLSPYESVIFAEQHGDQYEDASKALHKDVYAPIGRYIQTERERCGLTRSEVEVALGFVSKSDPNRGTALCYRWEEGSSLPTKETYERLRELLNKLGDGQFLSREYEDLRREYEDLRRPFFVDASVPFTDTWDFSTVQPFKGKHICEKPLSMMKHIIEVSSRKGDTVLDCFAGSGTTGAAAISTGRKFIGIELDPKEYHKAARRLSQGVLGFE